MLKNRLILLTCEIPAAVDVAINAELNAASEQNIIRRSLRFVPAHASAEQRAQIEQETDDALRRRALALTSQFAQQLPAIRNLLVSDVQAAYQGDPAANHVSEILRKLGVATRMQAAAIRRGEQL